MTGISGIDDLVDFKAGYLEWLVERFEAEKYLLLFEHLYETEFTWSVRTPMDANRAEDGKQLRWRFAEDCGWEIDPSWDDIPCSMLEMFGALAIDIEDQIMYDWNEGDRTVQWFWMMMDNLGLSRYRDSMVKRSKHLAYAEIDQILYIFATRQYEDDGRGSAFPLENVCDTFCDTFDLKVSQNSKSVTKLADLELWDQAQRYCLTKLLSI